MHGRHRGLLLPTLLLTAACSTAPTEDGAMRPADPSASTVGVTAASARPPSVDAGLPPLAGDWLTPLPLVLPGGSPGSAWVAPPVGATEPRPVIVAAHGAIDDSGLICSAWRIIADVYPFVVCPSGTKVRKDTYVWPSSKALDDTVDAALVALRARYGAHVAEGPAIYVAFSQGANLAGPVITRASGRRFARVVLTEGGYRPLETRAAARAFGDAGGERVLFTCSQPGCATWFAASASALERENVPAHVLYAGSHGHSMPPEVRVAIHDALPWVVEGLASWRTYADHPKLATH